MKITDIREKLIEKVRGSNYRVSDFGRFIELQNVHFECDEDEIFPEINHGFSEEWYEENYFPIIKEQIDCCVDKLVENPDSRQAILVMADRECYKKNDFTCTVFMQVFINEDKMKYIVNMRSSDAARFPNDLKWHKKILSEITEKYMVKTGMVIEIEHIEWNAMSLHIYEPDVRYLEVSGSSQRGAVGRC